MLELLARPPAEVPSRYNDVSTREEFEFLVKRWLQRRHLRYRILYLSFHGEPGRLFFGNARRTPLELEELAELLGPRCRGKLIHFGSCGTLDVPLARINRFLTATDATAVCGFRYEVDWLVAAGTELLLLDDLQFNVMTRAGMRAAKQRFQRRARGLTQELGFRMFIRP